MKKGEVWLYKDMDVEKTRPCVIVGNRMHERDSDVVIAKITSHPPRNEFDVPLKFWKEYGIRNASTVRCAKLFTIKEEDLMFKVADIDIELDSIKLAIARYIMEN